MSAEIPKSAATEEDQLVEQSQLFEPGQVEGELPFRPLTPEQRYG